MEMEKEENLWLKTERPPKHTELLQQICGMGKLHIN